MLEFSATSDGWSAATGNGAYRCAVYSGNAEVAGIAASEVVCEDDDTKASRAMMEWYEAL